MSTVADILATTLQKRLPKYRMLIENSNPVLQALRIGRILNEQRRGQKFSKPVMGGTFIEIPIVYRSPSTGQFYSEWDVLSNEVRSMSAIAKYEWRNYAIFVGIAGPEKYKNMGETALINQLAARIEACEQQIANEFHNALLEATPAPKAFNTLPQIISDTPATGTLGGINRATYSWWRNHYAELHSNNAALSFDGLTGSLETRVRSAISSFMRYLNRGASRVNVILAGRTWYEALVRAMFSLHRVVTQNAVAADLGVESVEFEGVPVIPLQGYDVGEPSLRKDWYANDIFFLNTDVLYMVVHPQRDFAIERNIRPTNQDAEGVRIYWMGQLVCEDPTRLGRMKWIVTP